MREKWNKKEHTWEDETVTVKSFGFGEGKK